VKKPGGKTLKIEAEIENGKIVSISFSGDFFAYPPEALEEMEQDLISTDITNVEEKVNKYKGKLTLLGVSFDDIIELLKKL